LIAGGAGGVGLACARALAVCGVELILCDIDGAALTSAARALGAFTRYCNAIDESSVAIFANEISHRYGSIDALINTAGRGYVRALAMMRVTRAFMPLLRRAKGSRLLVNIAPAGGFVASDNMFPYASSLASFERLSEALSEQVRGTSIEIATIAPKLAPAPSPVAGSPRLYQLQRVDEESTANRVMALVVGACCRSTLPDHNGAPQRSARSS